MIPSQREAVILGLLREHGVVTVDQIATHCNCSHMSARRDLRRLEEQGAIKRTHGGALRAEAAAPAVQPNGDSLLQARNAMVDRSDALIITPWVSPIMAVLVERARRSQVPIIAESMNYQGAATYVAIDDYGAGVELGRWVGDYLSEHAGGPVQVLDVTGSLPNCVLRSRGFADGLRSVYSGGHTIIRVDGKHVRRSAREVIANALALHPGIDVVMGINDDMALAALDAWQAAGLDPSRLLVVSFGLEGHATKELLLANGPYKAGVAMFPELVGRACVDAATCAYHGCALPERVAIPTRVLTREDLEAYYEHEPAGGHWLLRARAMERLIGSSPSLAVLDPCGGRPRPARLGFVEVFSSHEWYQNVQRAMADRAHDLGIRLEVIDASQDLDREVATLARTIGRAAAEFVAKGDTVILDSGRATGSLANALCGRQDITVITNSLEVLENLADEPGIRLMSSGGLVGSGTRAMVGHSAEDSFRDIRATKAFVTCSGLSLDFGLSSLSLSELGVKQAMLRAAREVIVLTDHTKIGSESLLKVAPIESIHRVITDAGISEHDRLALTQRGVEVTIAED